LSANAQLPNQKEKAQARYDEYLVKPIANSVLLEKLSEYLSLNWIRQSEAENEVSLSEAIANIEHLNSVKNFVLPDHSLLRELKAYAEMGYTKGVMQTLKQIEQADIISDEFYQYIESLSQSFQFEKLATSLENPTT